MCSRKKNNVEKYYNNSQCFIRKTIEFFPHMLTFLIVSIDK
jgi:hypothetical protein